MFLKCLMQLFLAMTQRPFCQKVDSLTATCLGPVHTLSAVHETKHLHPVEHIYLLGVTANHTHSLFLALRNTCRGHLDTIHVQVAQQHTGDDQLLMRQETHTAGLLTVAQGGVHDLHKRLYALIHVYLFACSHCSVLS